MTDRLVGAIQQGIEDVPPVDDFALEAMGATPDDPNFFESVAAGASSSNFMIEAARASTADRQTFLPEEGFSSARRLHDEEFTSLRALVEQDDSAREALLVTQSSQEFDAVADAIRRKQERLATAMGNGTLVGMGSMLAGGIFDLTSLVPAIGFAKALVTTAKSVKQARLAGASRFALLGAADQAAFTGLEGITDPTIGAEDFFANMGIGALIGGGIGAAAPRLAGAYVERGAIHTDGTADAVEDSVKAVRAEAGVDDGFGSVGAAARPISETGAERIGKKGAPALGGKMSMASRSQTMSRESVDTLEPHGLTASSEAYTLVNRLIPHRANTEAELLGEGVAAPNATLLQQEFEMGAQVAELRVVRAYEAAFESLERTKGTRPIQIMGKEVQFPFQRRLSQNEFLQIANDLRMARFHGENTDQIWPEGLDLSRAEKEAVLKHATEAADEMDRYYETNLKRLLDSGRVNAEDLKTNKEGAPIPYEPQRFKRDAILEDTIGFKDWLRMMLAKEPMDEFLVAEGFVEGIEETVDGETVVRASQNFQQLRASDPELAEEAAQRWTTLMQDKAEARAEQAADEIRAMAREKGKAAVRVVVEKHIARTKAVRDKVDDLEAKLAQAEERLQRALKSPRVDTSSQAHLKRVQSVGRLQRRLTESQEILQTHLDDLQFMIARRHTLEDMDKFISREARRTPKVRRLAREQAAKDKKATKIEKGLEAGEVTARFDFEAILDRMVENVAGTVPKRGYGFMSDTVEGQTSRLLPKQFDISRGEVRNHPLTRQFYDFNVLDGLRMHTRDIGSRLSLDEALGGQSLNSETQRLARRFNEDIAKAETRGLTKEARLLKRHRDIAIKDITEFGRRFTGMPDDVSPTVSFVGHQIRKINPVGMLGSVIFALPGDIALQEMANGRVGSGLRASLKAPEMKSVLKQLEAMDQDRLVVLLSEIEHVRGVDMRSLRISEIDDVRQASAIGQPGTVGYQLSRLTDATTNSAVNLMMKLNLMRYWNHFNRSSFGDTFMFDTIDDFATGWDQMDQVLQAKYRRLGVGPEEADAIAKLFNKHRTIEVRRLGRTVKYPDLNAMSKEDPVLANRFMRVIKGAMKEAIIEPELGSTPWMSKHPIGGLLTQFLGFPIMATQAFARPLGQHANTPIFYSAIMTALMASAVGDYLRHATRGEGDEWLANLESEEGWAQIFYTSWLRSPLAFGLSANFAEIMTKTVGRPFNDILEEAGMPRLAPQAGKFKEQNVLATIGGPTASQIQRIFGLTNALVGSATDPDERERLYRQALHGAPFMSLFYMRALEAYLSGDFE